MHFIIIFITFISICDSQERIQKIEILGLKQTQEKVVKREIIHRIGDVVDTVILKKERSLLLDLDLFAEVNIRQIKRNDSLILSYEMKELLQNLFFPAGKKTDGLGWIVGPAYTSLNLAGLDIRIEAFYRTSIQPQWFETNEFLTSLSSPYLFDLPIQYDISLLKLQSKNEIIGFEENSLHFKGEFQPVISKYQRLLAHIEFFQIDHIGDKKYLSHTNKDYYSLPILGWIWDSRNQRINTHNGLYQEVSWGQSLNFASNIQRFYQGTIDTRFFWSPSTQHIFLFSALSLFRIGASGFYNDRYFGGPNSYRILNLDSTQHGQSEILSSLEYRYEWFDKSPYRVNSLNIDSWWGLQNIFGIDFVSPIQSQSFYWNDIKNARKIIDPFVGLDLLIPGIDRLRFILGLNTKKVELNFSTGLFEKTQTQRWRSR